MRHMVLARILILASILLAGASCDTDTEGAHRVEAHEQEPLEPLLVSPKTIDLGEAPTDSVVTGTYLITNQTDRIINVTNVKANCGCHRLSWRQNRIKPGEEVTLSVDFAMKEAEFLAVLYLESDDSKEGFPIQVSATGRGTSDYKLRMLGRNCGITCDSQGICKGDVRFVVETLSRQADLSFELTATNKFTPEKVSLEEPRHRSDVNVWLRKGNLEFEISKSEIEKRDYLQLSVFDFSKKAAETRIPIKINR